MTLTKLAKPSSKTMLLQTLLLLVHLAFSFQVEFKFINTNIESQIDVLDSHVVTYVQVTKHEQNDLFKDGLKLLPIQHAVDSSFHGLKQPFAREYSSNVLVTYFRTPYLGSLPPPQYS